MSEIGAFEAKTQFSKLLARVQRGEEITVTLRGKPVARLVPLKPGFDKEQARKAMEDLRAVGRRANLGPFDWNEWKRYRDEGRREPRGPPCPASSSMLRSSSRSSCPTRTA